MDKKLNNTEKNNIEKDTINRAIIFILISCTLIRYIYIFILIKEIVQCII